jgi:hypothetical protein
VDVGVTQDRVAHPEAVTVCAAGGFAPPHRHPTTESSLGRKGSTILLDTSEECRKECAGVFVTSARQLPCLISVPHSLPEAVPNPLPILLSSSQNLCPGQTASTSKQSSSSSGAQEARPSALPCSLTASAPVHSWRGHHEGQTDREVREGSHPPPAVTSRPSFQIPARTQLSSPLESLFREHGEHSIKMQIKEQRFSPGGYSGAGLVCTRRPSTMASL